MRDNIPKFNKEKFFEIEKYICKNFKEILPKDPKDSYDHQDIIFKASSYCNLLYKIDFGFYEKFKEQLSGASYEKHLFGFFPIEEMNLQDNPYKTLSKIKTQKPLIKVDFETIKNIDLTREEKNFIDAILDREKRKKPSEIIDDTLRGIPWLVTKMHQVADYKTVFYRPSELSVTRRKPTFKSQLRKKFSPLFLNFK